MNKKTKIEVLKKELNSLENLVGNFQRNATSFRPNFNPNTFNSSAYLGTVRTASQNVIPLNSNYKNTFNLKHRAHYKNPNEFRSSKFTFVANKDKQYSLDKSQLTTTNPLLKCVNPEIKAKSLKSTVSSHAQELNTLLNILSKTKQQSGKTLNNVSMPPSTVIPSNLDLDSENCLNGPSIKLAQPSNKDHTFCSKVTQLPKNDSSVEVPIKPDNCHILKSSNQTNENLLTQSRNNGTLKSLASDKNSIIVNRGKFKCDTQHATVSTMSHSDASMYKFVNKDPSSLQNLSVIKQDAFKRNATLNILQRNSVAISSAENCKNISKIFSSSKQLQEENNRFKLVNKNIATSRENENVFKYSSVQNFHEKKPSLLLKPKPLFINQYSTKSFNRVSSVNSSRFVSNFDKSKSFCSKYKVTNESSLHLTDPAIYEPKKDILKNKIPDLVNEINGNTDRDLEINNNECTTKITNHFLNKKINQLKFKCPSNDELDILTDFSPDELVAMDTQSLLKLTALLKSDTNRPSLVKKSKYKLVSKWPSLLNKTAKMIKTKYRSKNWNSPKVWKKQSIYKMPPYKSNQAKYESHNRHLYRTQMGVKLVSANARYKKTNISNTSYMSKMKLIRTFRKPLILKNGKTLPRKTNARSFYNGTSLSTARPQIKNWASRVLHRSIQTASRKKDTKKTNTYCMFFNRFGKCNRGSNCPYIHDPSKIAVCTRFLRGTCKLENCPFSHEISPGKMAICSYYLQGLCTKENCPYRHEQLQANAELCKMFVQGYCSLGTKCMKAHVLICPDHFKGECEKGNSCVYPHPPRKERKNCSSGVASTGNVSARTDKSIQFAQGLSDDNHMEDISRYFNDEVTSGQNILKIVSVKSDKESISCQPQRGKMVDCPIFIPL